MLQINLPKKLIHLCDFNINRQNQSQQFTVLSLRASCDKSEETHVLIVEPQQLHISSTNTDKHVWSVRGGAARRGQSSELRDRHTALPGLSVGHRAFTLRHVDEH